MSTLLSVNQSGRVLIILQGDDHAAEAYKDTVQRFLGHTDLPLRFVTAEAKGFFTRIMEAARA